MAELTRITLATGVELDVAVAGDPAQPADHPAPRLSRIAPHLAPHHPRSGAGPFRPRPRPARLCALVQARRRRELHARQDRRRPARARRPFRHRRASRWSGTTGAARSRGWRRCSIPTASRAWSSSTRRTRFVFQQTLFDDMAQREASQYITALPQPRSRQAYRLRSACRSSSTRSFMRHTDFDKIADEKPSISTNGASPAR